MKAIRIRDREVLASPLVQDLFLRAFKEDHMPDAEDAWAWCGASLTNQNVAVIVVRNEESELVGLAVGDWADSVWSPEPVVLSLYSNGQRGVVDALLAEIRVWGLGLGQRRVGWINTADISDRAYARFVGKHVKNTKPEGSVLVGEWRE